MPNQSRAWLLNLGQGRYTGVGYQHMMEFVTETPMFEIPLAPRYCVGVMLWRHNIVPIIDLNRLVGATSDATCEHRGVGILAYQEAPGEPLRYGGLLLEAEPREVAVSDDMARPLPAYPAGWWSVSLSCFSLDGQAVPILHVEKIFEERFRREAAPESFATEHSGDSDAAETPPATDDAMPASAITGRASEVSAQSNRAASEPPPVIAASGAGLERGSTAADHSWGSEIVVDRSNETPPMPGERVSSVNPVVTSEDAAPSEQSVTEPAPSEDEKAVESSTGTDEQMPVAPAPDESGEATDTAAAQPPGWLSDWRARAGRS